MLHRPPARTQRKRHSPAAATPAITQLQPRAGASSSRLGLRTIPRPEPAPVAPATTAHADPPVAHSTASHSSTQAATPPGMWDHRRWLKALGVLALILVVTALSQHTRTVYPPPSSPGFHTYELRGYLAISAPAPSVLVAKNETVDGTDDAACWGQSQYSDIQEGTVVTVYDDRDQKVAEGYLGPGRTPRLALPTSTMPTCWFPILVKDIPTTSAFYQVKVGQRGTIEIENDPTQGVLRAFPTLDPTDGLAPSKPGYPGVAQPPDPNIPTVVPST